MKHHIRSLLRLIAVGLLVVGAILASSWFDMLLRATALGGSSSRVGAPETIDALKWAIPFLFSGMLLMLLTTRRDRFISLAGQRDDA